MTTGALRLQVNGEGTVLPPHPLRVAIFAALREMEAGPGQTPATAAAIRLLREAVGE
jgi:hypothetical protein